MTLIKLALMALLLWFLFSFDDAVDRQNDSAEDSFRPPASSSRP